MALTLLCKFVTDPAHCDQHVSCTHCSEFLPQVGHVHIHNPVHAREVRVPHPVQEVIPAEHAAGSESQSAEQIELQGSDCDFPVSVSYCPARGVNLLASVFDGLIMWLFLPV